MAYFEFLNHLAWTGPGQEMVPKSMWFNFPPGLDRELARRLGDIGNTAASTYCGIHPADVPYMGGMNIRICPGFGIGSSLLNVILSELFGCEKI